jgi:AcrR family transcriptional regulator
MPSVRVDSAAGSVRLEPVQQRSTKRLEDLLNAAATYIHDNGFETLSTAHVAEIAGSSIGTVYRYFPDRIALLDALAQRNAERAEHNVAAMVSARQPATLADLTDVAVSTLTEMFRQEVGFRAIRLGDPLDIRPARESRWGVRAYAKATLRVWSSPTQSGDAKAMELALDVAEATLAKAFLQNPKGERSTIAHAAQLARLALGVGR